MFQHLSDIELESTFRNHMHRERVLVHEMLMQIQEMESRKLFLKRARSSLFEYLTKNFGLSEGSAQRRIDASRLAKEVPELLDMVRRGTMHLSQISLLQVGVRQKEKIAPVSIQLKKAIISQLEYASYRQSEKIIAEALELPALVRTKVSIQGDQTVRLEISLKQQDWEKLDRCREILSHKNPMGDLPTVLALVFDFFLEKRDSGSNEFTATLEVPPRRESKNISTLLRQYIFRRDKSCRYQDPVSNQTCGSRFQLEVDHIKMRCHGGSNDPENLRLLCRAHNQLVAHEAMS